MQPPRGYWARSSEDYLTAVLFQPLASLSGHGWLDFVLRAAGLDTASALATRFAFSCEEVLDGPLLSRHGRNFVIPDIMLHWRGERSGLLAFEVKKPRGTFPNAQDVTKLETYTMLPSTRKIAVRQGVFLVDDRHVAVLKRDGYPALGWSMVHLALMEGLNREPGPPADIEDIAQGLTRIYRAAGVMLRKHSVPAGTGGSLSPKLIALKIGLRVREAALRGERPLVPFDWLADEPSRAEIPALCLQDTAQRRINRWSLDWRVEDEA